MMFEESCQLEIKNSHFTVNRHNMYCRTRYSYCSKIQVKIAGDGKLKISPFLIMLLSHYPFSLVIDNILILTEKASIFHCKSKNIQSEQNYPYKNISVLMTIRKPAIQHCRMLLRQHSHKGR